jgi:hypothetical protein
MLVAAAVCPCPPLLVPEVASGAASELDRLRSACDQALAALAAASPDHLYLVGPADPPDCGPYPQGASGSFRGYGVDRTVRLGVSAGSESAPSGRPLPPSLAVGAWLLERAGWSAPCEGLGVETSLAPGSCTGLGRALAAASDRVALLVLGDGSARRSVKAPGYLDERAEIFDGTVSAALAKADRTALAALDPELAEALQAVGRSPWQILAGAAEGTAPVGRLLYDDAPYGVGYLVASWIAA